MILYVSYQIVVYIPIYIFIWKNNDSFIFVSITIELFQFVSKLKIAVLYPFAYIIIQIETRSELFIKYIFFREYF